MNKLLNVSSSPHVRSGVTTKNIMYDVAIAMIPATVWGVMQFGLYSLLVVAATVLSCVLSEYVFEVLMKKPVTISDGSALVTGMILGLNMPPSIPIWMPVLGGVFSIIVVKQLYGGLGQNFMNPALAGRCFLLISFAGSMNSFIDPMTNAVSGATPLAVLKDGGSYDLAAMFLGKIPGTIGEISTLALLIGAAYLLAKKVISIRIPGTYILTFAVFAFIFGMNALTVTDPDGNTVLNPQAVSLIRGFAAATVFNFPLVEAMAGGRPVLILAYFAGLIVLLAIAVALCSVFYRKAIRQNAEGGGAAPKKSTAAQYRSAPLTRLLIEKEIKSVLTTPNLLISSLMGIVMAPVFMFVFGKVLPVGFGGTSEGGFNGAVGMVTYLAYLMSAMGSLTSAVGISREGKNFALLKSLPIAPSVVIRSKLLFSAGITAVSVVVNTVVFPFATGVTSPVAIVGFVLAILCGGVGNSTLGLYYDLKNPNLKWTNPNELTQNNKKMLKPTLISVGAGIVFLILSPVAAMLGWNHHAAYALFFGAGLVLPVATAVYGIVKLKDHPEKLWDQIEI